MTPRRTLTTLSLTLALAACSPPSPAPTQTGNTDPAKPTPTTTVQIAQAPIDEIAKAPERYTEASAEDGWSTTTLVGSGDRGVAERMTRGRGGRLGGGGGPGKRFKSKGGKPMAPPAGDAGADAREMADKDASALAEAEGKLEMLRKSDGKAAPARSEARKLMDATKAAPKAGRPGKKSPANNWGAMPKLKAGAVDDNLKWDEYLTFHGDNQNLLPEKYRLDIRERYIVEVVDRAGRPLPNARVGVAGDDKLLLEGRTVSNGRVLFFPRTAPEAKGVEEFAVTVQFADETVVKTFARKKHGADKPWTIKLDVDKGEPAVKLDIVFCLDATGSMSDEIRRIQATLLQITRKIREMKDKPQIRYGMVLYKDRTDDYITRRFGFTSDAKAFDKALKQVSAGGGGDTPEALNMGLFAAIDQMPWAEDALRLTFLVADAPPHLDYTDDVPYTRTLKSAVEKGIKVFPTAASGLDPRGTYIMRQIAQFTHARFLYIEYGGGTAARHGVEKPTTPKGSNNLDDIVLRIVQDELKDYTR